MQNLPMDIILNIKYLLSPTDQYSFSNTGTFLHNKLL